MTHPIDRLHARIKRGMKKALRKGGMLDRVTSFLIPPSTDDLGAPEQHARSAILFGAWMVLLVFGVFGLWSVLAPLDSAAIAPGHVVVDSNRKTISHYEGGIAEAIMVNDGQIVEEGEPLLRLRGIQARAQVDLLKTQFINSLAIEARLLAERDEQDAVFFPENLAEYADESTADEIVAGQKSIFKSRTENVRGQLDVLETRIAQHQQEIRGLDMQQKAMTEQIAFLNEEIDVVAKLLEDGNASRPRLLALKREAAELVGRRGEYMAMKAKAQESIAETQISILNTKSEYMNKVLEELKETQQFLAETREKMTASSDVLTRVVIRAPERGIVNDLVVHTVGGVIKPGEKILDLIPLDDKLIIEARVAPQDIDVVRKSLPARVRLTAFKVREVPVLDGTVIHVSADQMVDERSGESYFLSRIEIDRKELQKLSKVELYPGMPAEALILTGSHSFMSYLFEPITNSFRRAFRQE